MKTRHHSTQARQIEFLRLQPVRKKLPIPNLLIVIRQIWCGFLDLCILSSEPRIRSVTDRSGKVRWRVNDPNCSRVLWFESYEQLLVWLEKRHHKQTEADKAISNLDAWR